MFTLKLMENDDFWIHHSNADCNFRTLAEMQSVFNYLLWHCEWFAQMQVDDFCFDHKSTLSCFIYSWIFSFYWELSFVQCRINQSGTNTQWIFSDENRFRLILFSVFWAAIDCTCSCVECSGSSWDAVGDWKTWESEQLSFSFDIYDRCVFNFKNA